MSYAKFQYKCRRCGEIKDNTECGEKIAIKYLIGAICKMSPIKNQLPLLMLDYHICKDKGGGVADLIGYEVIKEK